jgi:hypothetical protein
VLFSLSAKVSRSLKLSRRLTERRGASEPSSNKTAEKSDLFPQVGLAGTK